MAKDRTFEAFAAAMFALCTMASGAHAQVTAPPPLITVPGPPVARVVPPLERQAPTPEILTGVAQCMQAIGADRQFDAAVLVRFGWRRAGSYRDAEQELRTEYWRGNLINEVLDLERLDGCFTKAKIADVQQLIEIRQDLIDTYGLVPFDEYEGLDDFKRHMLDRFGNEVRKNILFADDRVFVLDVTEHSTGLYLAVSNTSTRN